MQMTPRRVTAEDARTAARRQARQALSDYAERAMRRGDVEEARLALWLREAA